MAWPTILFRPAARNCRAPPPTIASATGYTFGDWTKNNVSVNLNATDNAGGSGVKEITYSASGAQPIASTTASGASVSLRITALGTTTLTDYLADVSRVGLATFCYGCNDPANDLKFRSVDVDFFRVQ